MLKQKIYLLLFINQSAHDQYHGFYINSDENYSIRMSDDLFTFMKVSQSKRTQTLYYE